MKSCCKDNNVDCYSRDLQIRHLRIDHMTVL